MACDWLLVMTVVCTLETLVEVVLLDCSPGAIPEDDGVGVIVTVGVVGVVDVAAVGVGKGAGGGVGVNVAGGVDEGEGAVGARATGGGRLPAGRGTGEGFDVWEVVVFDLVLNLRPLSLSSSLSSSPLSSSPLLSSSDLSPPPPCLSLFRNRFDNWTRRLLRDGLHDSIAVPPLHRVAGCGAQPISL